MIRLSTVIVVFVALCGASLSVRLRDLDDRSLREVTQYAKNLIIKAAGADRATYVAANTTYNDVKTVCWSNRKNETLECNKCAMAACKSDKTKRCGKKSDKPNFWKGVGQMIEGEVLSPVGDFFKDDVGDFFKEDVGGAFKDAGNWITDDFAGGVVDVANDVSDWVKGDFKDFWANDFAGGVADTANDVADFLKDDLAGGVSNAAEAVGDWLAGDFAKFWHKDVGGTIKNVGKKIGGWFGGKRKRQSIGGAQPPSCDKLTKSIESAVVACKYYKDGSHCSTCTQPSCPKFTQALNTLNTTSAAYSRWYTSSDGTSLKYPGSGDYRVNAIRYDPGAYNSQADGWTGVSIQTSLFGRTFTFTLKQAVDVHKVESLAPIIFTKTLQAASA